MLKEILVLLISLAGIIFGLVLSYLAPEEFSSGKRYFLFLKRVLLGIILIFVNYTFLTSSNYLIMSIFTVFMVGLFVLEMNWFKISLAKSQQIVEISNYLIFIFFYFFLAEQQSQLVLASLIFLYGLPAGTLLRKIN